MVSSLIHRRGATPNPSNPLFGFGIEEEYFLACAETMAPAIETPQSLFERSEGPQFQRELLQAQLEVATRPQGSAGAARRELKQLRLAAAEAASEHGLVLLAAGTHPLADWRQAIQSPKQRYQEVMDCLQMLGRRNMLCAMHVHVELPDPSQRVDVMVRMLPYLPLLLALSTSSPFWESQRTGLKGYRLAAYDELPRTGLPEMFSDEREYQIYLDAMMRSGAISDASHVWWSIRPAQHYPTLELRATDCCTRIDDAIAIASLYRAIVRHLYLNPDVNRGLNAADRAIAAENKWRAQRYGIDASFVSRGGAVPIADVLKDICVQIAHDIEALDCVDEIYHCHSLLSEGTSADAQLRICEQYEDRGMSHALRAVCRWIADATLAA